MDEGWCFWTWYFHRSLITGYLLFIEFIPHSEHGQTNPVPLHVLFCLISFNFSNVPVKGSKEIEAHCTYVPVYWSFS